MSSFPKRLRLKEMAEEDIYFARRDRELKERLRQRRRGDSAQTSVSSDGGRSGDLLKNKP